MDVLKNAVCAYQDLLGKEHHVCFSNGKEIIVVFQPANFIHLAGLRKLTDLPVLSADHSAIYLYRLIKQGKLTLEEIKCSIHYNSEIHDRIGCISRIGEVMLSGRAVWDFDGKKARVRTKLKSSVIFFKEDNFNFYLTFGVAQGGSHYYPETIFYRYDDGYIRGQNIVSVRQVMITDCPKGNQTR